MGKNERKYIKKLNENIEGYCEEANITSKQELYDNYGNPNDVVNDYCSTVDTDYIIKKIKISKYIKFFIATILVLITIATSTYCVLLYNSYQTAARQEVVICDQSIEEIIE
jgi:hypothetical protein